MGVEVCLQVFGQLNQEAIYSTSLYSAQEKRKETGRGGNRVEKEQRRGSGGFRGGSMGSMEPPLNPPLIFQAK